MNERRKPLSYDIKMALGSRINFLDKSSQKKLHLDLGMESLSQHNNKPNCFLR